MCYHSLISSDGVQACEFGSVISINLCSASVTNGTMLDGDDGICF